MQSMFLACVMSICLSVTWLRCANTAERIEVLVGVETLRDRRNIVLDWGLESSH